LEANSAYRDLMRLDLELFPFGAFAERAWALRDNLPSYDAWYVALAEALAAVSQRWTNDLFAPPAQRANSSRRPSHVRARSASAPSHSASWNRI
jgi:hypothetical protein